MYCAKEKDPLIVNPNVYSIMNGNINEQSGANITFLMQTAFRFINYDSAQKIRLSGQRLLANVNECELDCPAFDLSK